MAKKGNWTLTGTPLNLLDRLRIKSFARVFEESRTKSTDLSMEEEPFPVLSLFET
jgi:hypothetical protein